MNLSTLRTTCLRAGVALAAFSISTALLGETPAASPLFIFHSTVADPTRDVRYQPEGVSSSNEDGFVAGESSTLAAERANLSGDDDQPPPGRRRTYGRSRYQDKLHNADGSSKIAFVAGAGLNVPVGNTAKYYTPSFAILAGAGFNFNKMFGVLGEFHYDRSNLTLGSLSYQNNVYVNFFQIPQSYLTGLDGNAHMIALTVNPVVNFVGADRGSRLGAYVTGGVGYYRKSTNFTLPTQFNSIYGSYVQNQTFDSYSANAFGANGGAGLTYKLSEFSSERLFIEARYHWLKINANPNDAFPYNARNTEYVPITVGIRF